MWLPSHIYLPLFFYNNMDHAERSLLLIDVFTDLFFYFVTELEL